jgi:hypothetical protein
MGEHAVSTATQDAPERVVDVEGQARVVMNLLREYAGKLSALNTEILQVFGYDVRTTLHHQAWVLDQSELMWKPLLKVLSRGSALREHALLDALTEDELNLRMIEAEIHIDHNVRLADRVRERIVSAKLTEPFARLRFESPLSGMKGGPLRPV